MGKCQKMLFQEKIVQVRCFASFFFDGMREIFEKKIGKVAGIENLSVLPRVLYLEKGISLDLDPHTLNKTRISGLFTQKRSFIIDWALPEKNVHAKLNPKNFANFFAPEI